MAQLLPGQVTLAQIRTRARVRADQLIGGAPIVPTYPDPYANSRFSTPTLNDFINESAGELYEMLVNQFSSYWFTSTMSFTSTTNAEQYAAPLDMQKFLSLEWVQTPGSTVNNVVLKRMNLQERDFYNLYAFAPPVFSLGNCVYMVFGKNLWLKPAPSAGLSFLATYVPQPLPLTDQGTITMNGVTTGDLLNFTLDGTLFGFVAAPYGTSPSNGFFIVGGEGASNLGDAGTAQSLAKQLQVQLTGANKPVSPAVFTAVASPASGATTGTSLVAISLTDAATVTWSASNNHMLLSPSASTGPTANGPITWTNIFSAYTGLDEYMTVDAAIKMGITDKDTIAELQGAKAALVQRYNQNFSNRDPGQPRTITNVRRARYGPAGWRGGRL